MLAFHAIFDANGHDDLIILEFAGDNRSLRQLDIRCAEREGGTRDIANEQTVGIDLFSRKIGTALHAKIIAVRDRDGVFAVGHLTSHSRMSGLYMNDHTIGYLSH